MATNIFENVINPHLQLTCFVTKRCCNKNDINKMHEIIDLIVKKVLQLYNELC